MSNCKNICNINDNAYKSMTVNYNFIYYDIDINSINEIYSTSLSDINYTIEIYFISIN